MAMDSQDAPQMIEHLRKSVSFTPHDTRWMPQSARFASCGISPNGKGSLLLTELARDELKTVLDCKDILPHGIKCATFGATDVGNHRTIAVGDYSGGLSLFDLDHCTSTSSGTKVHHDLQPSKVFSAQAHSGIINCIDGIGGGTSSSSNKQHGSHGAPELVTGGRDGIAKVWDPRVHHPVVSLEPDIQSGSAKRDCWAVAFGNSYNDEERCVVAGYDNGDVKLFDLRTHSIRWEKTCSNGITSAEFDRRDVEMNKLVVTTLESTFECYDMRTYHANNGGYSYLKEAAHRSTIWLGRHLPQNRDIFMTGGGNGGFNLYKYHYPINRVGKHADDGLPVGKMGHVELLNSRVISTQPVTSFDWSPDKAGLCCLSCLDQILRVYIITKLEKY